MSTPKILGPDGVYRETTIFSTTLPSRPFEGTMDADTVDMQISIRGGAFTSDPDLLVFEGTTFRFPNESVFPEGLELAPGINTIEVRSISFSGAVSASAVVQVYLVQQANVGPSPSPPTRIYVEQLSASVQVFVQGPTDPTFRGINFYASRYTGGGSTGYTRINIQVVGDYETQEETLELSDTETMTTLLTKSDGTLAADPFFLHVTQGEYSSRNSLENPEDINPATEEEAAAAFDETVQSLLRTDFVRVLEIPENARTLRTTLKIESVNEIRIYSFLHNRQYGPANDPPTVPLGEFASLSQTEPLYYVTTALYYDPDLQIETESPFSAEVVGLPVTITQTLGTFPAPSQRQVVEDTVASLVRVQPELAIQPGAVIRDTMVDPISDEILRLRGLLDFMYRVQSFDTLIQIDGLEPDGTSTPVQNSAYKQALQRIFDLANPNDVQVIVDTAFEQLASRNNVFRGNGTRAATVVTFYTSKRPAATVSIPLGTRVASGSVYFVTTAYAEIPLSSLASFYDPSSGLYSVDVPARAEQNGKSGNVGPGQIRTLVSVIPGFSVINNSRSFGGQDRQTNYKLAVAARAALAAVDTGTEQGLLQLAAKLAGVESALVVGAGNALMQRDYESSVGKHVGGKVDVWIRGESLGQVTDTFAFQYEIAQNVQFVVVGNPLDRIFRALDVKLSADHPIAEMLDRSDLGLGFRNATTGQYLDLTDVSYLDYRTIQLTQEGPQPIVAFGDVLLGDYRYLSSTDLILSRQPVHSIQSVQGEIVGSLATDQYELVRPSDPLLNGRSVKADDTLRISSSVGADSFVDITNESHILFAEYDEYLDFLGANPLSIRVFDETKTIEYKGPQDPSGVSDFVLVGGTQTTAVAIRRTQTSTIRSGQRVLVDYSHSENFTVTYTTNFVIQVAQDAVSQKTHVTSDVLVKETVPVPVDVTATVVITQGTSTSNVDRRLRTNIKSFLRALPQGGQLREADVIRLLDATTGVSYVQLPLTKLARSAGSLVVREILVVESASDAILLLGTPDNPYSTSLVRVWLISTPLSSPTSTGGGSDANFRAIYQDDVALGLVLGDPATLKASAGKAYIIGNGGLLIPGYSDDTTIKANYPNANTASEIASVRQTITQNRVMVSVVSDDQPLNHAYTATYEVTSVENRTQSIELGELEFFEEGEFTFNYVEDRRK